MLQHWRSLCFVLAHLGLVCGFDLVRLTNPKADGSYMVEVRYDQKWRTLCGQNWHPANARVVCKQVGQPSTRCVADSRTLDSHNGENSEGINLNYKCLGNETGQIFGIDQSSPRALVKSTKSCTNMFGQSKDKSL